MSAARRARRSAGRVIALALALVACAPAAGDPMSYRLDDDDDPFWSEGGDDPMLTALRARYPAFFDQVLDPSRSDEANLRELRDDLEHRPVDQRNYDALNAVAIAYFEINHRAEAQRGEGLGYMSLSFRSAKLVAVPWRAYGEIDDPDLRDAILDFFADASSGRKLGSRRTAPRLRRVVESLGPKESDPARRARIDAIVADLQALEATLRAEEEP